MKAQGQREYETNRRNQSAHALVARGRPSTWSPRGKHVETESHSFVHKTGACKKHALPSSTRNHNKSDDCQAQAAAIRNAPINWPFHITINFVLTLHWPFGSKKSNHTNATLSCKPEQNRHVNHQDRTRHTNFANQQCASPICSNFLAESHTFHNKNWNLKLPALQFGKNSFWRKSFLPNYKASFPKRPLP